ncbi:MAG TPA: hypothetical protein VM779_02470 [Thermoanaerobaculia bacterium]|nr:hypothetical protein [Thermoanaerobaculia bacterium]
MRRNLILATSLLFVSASLYAHGRHGDFNISFQGDDALAGCGDLSVRIEGERVPVITENVPFHGSALAVRTDRNGGIRVTGSRGSGYAITVCKAVAPGIDPAAVRAVMAGNELTAAGPEGQRWVAYFLIEAPANASLDLHASNGPIAISRFHGTVRAEAVNGPVSVKDSSGTITAGTTNGPVSITGGSGNIKLEATNGPVTVKLADTVWDGSLEASTRNGPVSLKLPRGFRSGVLVEALGHGPVSCKAAGCPDLRLRSWEDQRDRPRRIELGSGPQVVRLSTVNGPVSVKEND